MGTYTFSGGPQYVQVGYEQGQLAPGTYDITAYGAAGGSYTSDGSGGSYSGGSGAKEEGKSVLKIGEVVEIIVGGAGGRAYLGGGGAGGGGGSFVLVKDNLGYTPPVLLVAGGGGGAPGGGGLLSNGGNASYGSPGSGQGGASSGYGFGAGGGAGVKSPGQSATGSYAGSGGSNGGSPTPYAGGAPSSIFGSGRGGFGGGGGGGGNANGGGGGGYTGGAGGYSAGGGTSFDRGTPITAGSAHIENTEYQGDGLVIFTAVCFASGTRLRTVHGDVAVEDLGVGDLIVTASGEHRPIRWLGHRTLDCRRHRRPREAMPVRVAAHAFGQNRPTRDLYLSPGHSVCVDVVGGVLIPIGRLVNGATIAQLDVDTVTYWHVELDSHDILLSEGLACESYIDCGTRAFFAESGVVALGASPDAPVLTTDDYCRPFKPEGALVDMVRDRLCLRAADLGWRLGVDDALAGLWLEVDGVRVEPVRHGLLARVTLPADTHEVRLRSASAVPADLFGDRDARRLGLRLASLIIDDGLGCRREIACTDDRLVDGFHPHEGMHRWTDGCATLPAELWAGCRGDVHLRLAFAGPVLPRWVPPANETVVAEVAA